LGVFELSFPRKGLLTDSRDYSLVEHKRAEPDLRSGFAKRVGIRDKPNYSMRTPHRVGLCCAALVLLSTVCHLVLQTPYLSWNGTRLMLSFALARGVNYYVLLPRGGPLYTSEYGPMVAIVYLPATLFRTPNSAVLAGVIITVVLCFSAVAFLHFAPLKRERSAVDGLAFLTAGFLMCYLDPLKFSCFNIHADGPGLAFGAVACGALLYAGGADKWRMALPVSAVCAVLSVFCKQMFLFLPIALLVWVLAVQGRKAAARYLLCLVAAGVISTAAALSAFGLEPLYHSLIWVPAHQPWKDSHIRTLIGSARLFIRASLPVLIPVLACVIYCIGAPMRDGRWRTLLMSRCVPPLLVGIALLPFSILGYAKVGGEFNNFSFALFFLTCGVTMMFADLWHGGDDASTRHLAGSALVATTLLLTVFEARVALDIPSKLRGLSQTEQQVAFAYLERHPGEAYFPWFPLAHLQAEGQLRHFVWGLADRWLAGEKVSSAELRAYIPRDPRVIAFGKVEYSGPTVEGYELMNLPEYSRSVNDPEFPGWPSVEGYDLMKYLPEYSRSVNDPELPGWLVFAKKAQ
jgi:hypothetical protein